MKAHKLLVLLGHALIPAVAALLVGCGTTSGLKTADVSALKDLKRYRQVSVLDFGDQTAKKAKAATPELEAKLREQGRHFADLIALELTKTQAFEKVSRPEKPLPDTLVISGDITRLNEGSSALRLWIGFGAGSTYFDAVVRVADADSGSPLGEILVDKNSWALGGSLAAGQTVKSFMEGAAKKIAGELVTAKSGSTASK